LKPSFSKMYYEDDNYHPNNDTNDYYEDIDVGYQHVGISDDFTDTMSYTTITSKRKQSKKEIDEMKKVDKGYHKIETPHGHKKLEIEMYSTPTTPGKPIRDAVTGYRYTKHLVGSLDEDLYFKTIVATGQLGKDGNLLFYNSPEEFERHMKVTVSPEIKQKWSDKCLAARLRTFEK